MAYGFLSTMPYKSLPASRALVDAAWRSLDPPLTAADSQRSVLVRLVCAMYLLHGSLGLPRGWVQAVQEREAAVGRRVTAGHSIRWYRSAIQSNAGQFLGTPGVDPRAVEAIECRYLG